jgi:uncharacterized membrane protein
MSETTEVGPPEQPAPPPATKRWPWWNILLIVSLAFNLLFGGAAAARFFFFHGGPPERLIGMSYLQLVPRRFFVDLDHARRDELMAVLRDYRDRFRAGQANSRKVAESLADALDAEPYDEAKVRQVVDAFAKNGSDMLGLGSEAAMNFIQRLTPAERTLLAQRIRERAGPGPKGPPPP